MKPTWGLRLLAVRLFADGDFRFWGRSTSSLSFSLLFLGEFTIVLTL
jgi:hypothetical protein